MRIGINALFWIPNAMGGTQTYFLRLMEALLEVGEEHEYVVFLNREGAAGFPLSSPRLAVDVCPVPGQHRLRRLLWENVMLDSRARALRLDLVHSLGYLSPLRLDAKSVVTVLDMVHYLYPYDIERSKRCLWRLLLPVTLRRVDRIITISESGKRDLAQLFPRAAAKATAVPLAVDTAVFCPDPSGSAEQRREDGTRTILAVASISPHKNLGVLVRAVAELRREGSSLRLLLVGQRSRTSVELLQLAEELGIGEMLEFTGHVPQETLVRLYRGAAVMVFPSLYEGFGLPPLEAMACGCPVIASSVSSIPEVVGDAALLFDPHDPIALAAHLRTVLASDKVRARLIARGFENVARFDWATTAARTLDVYADVAAADEA